MRPLRGRWGTCDGSQLFTHHSSLETLPFSLKNKYLLATGVCDGKWISGLDINTRIGSGKRGGGGPRSQCLVLSGKAPRRLTHSEKRERTPDPVCLNCMLKWGLSINISTQRNGRMLSHVQLMYTHTWHTHMLANSWVYTVACIYTDAQIKTVHYINKSVTGCQVQYLVEICLSFYRKKFHKTHLVVFHKKNCW